MDLSRPRRFLDIFDCLGFLGFLDFLGIPGFSGFLVSWLHLLTGGISALELTSSSHPQAGVHHRQIQVFCPSLAVARARWWDNTFGAFPGQALVDVPAQDVVDFFCCPSHATLPWVIACARYAYDIELAHDR